jgi:branched-subunit amino acid aminotransferase/4-amino-4-deoxychorismate lyase
MSLRSGIEMTIARCSSRGLLTSVKRGQRASTLSKRSGSGPTDVSTSERTTSTASGNEPRVVVSSADMRVVTDPPGGIAWLESMPRGAYTTTRTTGGGRCVFELGFHLQRLVDSSLLMALRVDGEALKLRAMETLRRGVEAYLQHTAGEANPAGEDDRELKLTVLVCNSGDVYVHVSPLGPRKAPGPVRVEIRGAPRANAAAKDSEWVTERKKLSKPEDVNELVLEANGALYEGLSSNFFTLMDGTLHTAGDNVLMGSVRESVLRQAAALGIPIVLDAPRLDDLPRWEAAFVSSTSRMLLPIDELTVRSGGNGGGADGKGGETVVTRTFDHAPDARARALDAAVKADILSSSESIF